MLLILVLYSFFLSHLNTDAFKKISNYNWNIYLYYSNICWRHASEIEAFKCLCFVIVLKKFMTLLIFRNHEKFVVQKTVVRLMSRWKDIYLHVAVLGNTEKTTWIYHSRFWDLWFYSWLNFSTHLLQWRIHLTWFTVRYFLTFTAIYFFPRYAPGDFQFLLTSYLWW
jgi:hypothetical protein